MKTLVWTKTKDGESLQDFIKLLQDDDLLVVCVTITKTEFVRLTSLYEAYEAIVIVNFKTQN